MRQFEFLELPAEIRNEIYRLLISTTTTPGRDGEVNLPLVGSRLTSERVLAQQQKGQLPAGHFVAYTVCGLFLLCKQVRQEARDLYYTEYNFIWPFFPDSSEATAARLTEWARAGLDIDTPKASLIRCIQLQFAEHRYRLTIRLEKDRHGLQVNATRGAHAVSDDWAGMPVLLTSLDTRVVEMLRGSSTTDQKGRVAMTTESLVQLASMMSEAINDRESFPLFKRRPMVVPRRSQRLLNESIQ